MVVCAPSLGDVRAEYRLLRPYLLAAGFRVATLDLRGHGESSVGWTDYSKAAIGSDLIALIRHLGATPAIIIGTSYAAGAAVCAAAQAPGLVAGLVLVGPFVRDGAGSTVQRTVMNVLLSRPWGPALWAQYFPKFYPTKRPPDFGAYRARLRANLREPGRIEALKGMINCPNAGVEDSLAGVTAPTLVVMGTKDPDFKDPAAEAEWIARQAHGTRMMVEGAGHYPHAEMPERLGPDLVAFLMRVGGGRGA